MSQAFFRFNQTSAYKMCFNHHPLHKNPNKTKTSAPIYKFCYTARRKLNGSIIRYSFSSKFKVNTMSENQSVDTPTPQADETSENFPSAPFMRRFASWVYDLLTGVAIAMLSTVVFYIFIGIFESIGLVSTEGYVDMADYLADGYVFQIYLFTCLCGFFSYFWVRGGQTIGMRAWRLRVLTHNNETISITQAVIRFCASLAGLGNLWVLVDFKNRQSLQDYAAKTKTVVLTKEENGRIYREIESKKS